MVERWDINVEIIDAYKKALPFLGLKSRVPVAVVFAFYGYKEEVLPLLQTLSHSTRAYIYNASGLKGFLRGTDIIKMLTMSSNKS